VQNQEGSAETWSILKEMSTIENGKCKGPQCEVGAGHDESRTAETPTDQRRRGDKKGLEIGVGLDGGQVGKKIESVRGKRQL